jgi:hypothetical protein
MTAVGNGFVGLFNLAGDGVQALMKWIITGTFILLLTVMVGCSQETRHDMARDVVYTAAAMDDLGYEGAMNGKISPTSSTVFSAGGISHVNQSEVNFDLKKVRQTKPKDQLLCPWLIDPYADTMDNVPVTQPKEIMSVTTRPSTQPAQ